MTGGQRTAKPGNRCGVCLSMMHEGVISFHHLWLPLHHAVLKKDRWDIEPGKRHFCAACQALFFVLAAKVPPAGLRKENGKLKINYTFANGETSDVEVNEEIGNLILDSRREESNQDRKERYHCYSLDAAEYEGEDYADGSTPETELFLQLENQRIKEAFEQLSEVQRRRLLMLAEGVSLREIARREGKDIKSIRESIERARKKFLKYF